MADKRKTLSHLRLFPSFSVKYKGGEEKKGGGVFSRDTGGKQSSTPVLLAVRGEKDGRQGRLREHKKRMEMEQEQNNELEQVFRSLPNQQKLRRRR